MLRAAVIATFVATILPACATDAPIDELADDSEDTDAGKGDEAGGAFNYFTASPDVRACSFDARCGGFFVARPNRASTVCSRGVSGSRCYVDSIDMSGTAMPKSIANDYLARLRSGEQMILKGDIVQGADDRGTSFRVTEIWTAGSATGVNEGVFVFVKDNGIRCITAPCPSLGETRLNSTKAANIDHVDFSVSGADEGTVELAQNAMFQDGVIVVGDRVTPNARSKGRSANQFFLRAPVPQF